MDKFVGDHTFIIIIAIICVFSLLYETYKYTKNLNIFLRIMIFIIIIFILFILYPYVLYL